jgi:hypothetical protein
MTEENPAAEWRAVELDSEAFKREFEAGDPVRISYEAPDGSRKMCDLVVCLPAKEHVTTEYGHKLVAVEQNPENYPQEYYRVKVFANSGIVHVSVSDGSAPDSAPELAGSRATVWTKVGGDEGEEQ